MPKIKNNIPAPIEDATDEVQDLAPQAPSKTSARVFSDTAEKPIDRFKLEAADCLKNRSFRSDTAEVEAISHIHFFDSHSARNGTIIVQAEPTCGHTHKMEFKRDAKGNIIDINETVCGQALQQKTITRAGGQKSRSLASIDLGIDPRTDKRVTDAHTHVVRYMKSQNVTIKI